MRTPFLAALVLSCLSVAADARSGPTASAASGSGTDSGLMTLALSLNAAVDRSGDGDMLAAWGGDRHVSGSDISVIDWDGELFGIGVDAGLRPDSDLAARSQAPQRPGSVNDADGAARPSGHGRDASEADAGAAMNSPSADRDWVPDGGPGEWVMAGSDDGEFEVDESGEGRRQRAVQYTMAGAGDGRPAAGRMVESGPPGLGIKSRESAAGAPTGGGDRTDSGGFDLRNLRLTLGGGSECAQDVSVGCLSQLVEIGLGRNRGDEATRYGLAIGGGLRYSDPEAGLTVEGRGRVLLSHRDPRDDWGIGGRVLYDPGADGLGLAFRLAPSFGAATGNVEQPYDLDRDEALPARAEDASSLLETEIGYGFAGLAGTGILTPYAGLSLADESEQVYRAGLRLEAGPAFGMDIEGKIEQRGTASPNRQILIRGRIRW